MEDRGERPDDGHALELVRTGAIEVAGRLLNASNATFYVALTGPVGTPPRPATANAVYKPVRGERPLWDFPDGTLARREVAAFIVSEAMGLRIVPPTAFRDGPLGEGMVQLWIEVAETADPLALVRAGDPALRRIALFDAVVNNTDRKIGHLLPLPDGHVYGVDHGVCFSVEPKLRTVLWNWRGRALEPEELRRLRRLRADLDGRLASELCIHLSPDEVDATIARIDALLERPVFPHPDPDRPAIPWPPF